MDTQLQDLGIETNLPDIVKIVFSKNPSIPFSNQLGLDNPVPIGENSTDYYNEMLNVLLLLGTKYKFGENAHPCNLSDSQYNLMSEYMASFGYSPKLRFRINERTGNTEKYITFEQYKYTI